MYIVTDWAGNVLNFKGYFQLFQLASPMEFKSFDEAWEWIHENVQNENCFEDIEVIKKETT